MCLIIKTARPSRITRAIAKSAQGHNEDGVGVMWYDADGRLRQQKWMNVPLKKWWPEWRKICLEAEAAHSELAVHWRMATHGTTDETMCHPYAIEAGDGLVLMMHNGIISGYGEKSFSLKGVTGAVQAEPAKSDTWEYARMLESILADDGGSRRIVGNAAFLSLLGGDIGSGNKLVFGFDENPAKTFTIANESAGVEYDGHWFSNTYAWDAYELSHGKVGTTAWAKYGTSTSYTRYTGGYTGKTWGADTWESENPMDYPLSTTAMAPEARKRATYFSPGAVVNAFRADVSAALVALEEIAGCSTRVDGLLMLAVHDRKEAERKLLADIEYFAQMYADYYS